jgi:hypothetical protein
MKVSLGSSSFCVILSPCVILSEAKNPGFRNRIE